ncbi:MAG: hypothetical protein A3A96_04430 [Candidatus Zambryskibacteria bacterium RIFCSPLOWO2_01_FULL_39_39]|uniref:Glycosyl transferase family 2 n=1 Tax=Candidatus Zambryskibacteria bacterium RIFCSPLOWO2_01_FULL_39_39 TaxID=1802758 RepID=A0A1G2TX76_9BACT|nr:MAG: Glycosidase related protein [Parcubacteria group bacterium GW2011_GWA1_38_7]OHA87378.1 MAG: hypothetical protein A2644_04110 [Candidatus Zambryskibacteria bacterium RIFCSPHIGHO2_01_FULL_39_63]OHA95343.1 MAG: hypothetical protein A3B88_02595 [Candidatus Zambryskibacteria bacterium RIFCSPHIGHO2_02_FULL_39_19]OHA97979.1 MAG: hypothetical protein A3F20_04365 [Candidatus Zambryskibacteria bacterium RIFCSPHIGHO2_12_FULL_39_21]OHB01773.1 MAG: hypothetical protein A3A96_04430 [Candidatus Zambry
MNEKTTNVYEADNLDYHHQLSEILNKLDGLNILAEVVIGVPFSRESEETVQSTLVKIQEGLEKYYPDKHFLLIALGESCSGVQINNILPPKVENIEFHGFHKYKNLIGKGWSMRMFVDIANHFNSHAVFFDADVSNIEYEWIKILLEPLFIKGKQCCVIPTVHRGAHDAETTNNLAFPLLSALYGKAPRHPLGGLRSFTSDVVKELASFTDTISNTSWFSESVSGYGIDIFYTIFSLKSGATIEEPYLGYISHSSLPVVDNGYKKAITQIVGSMFGFVEMDHAGWNLVQMEEITEKIETLFPPDADALAYLMAFKDNFLDNSTLTRKIVRPEIFPEIEHHYRADAKNIYLSPNTWAKIVYDFILYFHQAVSEEKRNILEAIFPIYCLRVGSFFRELQADADILNIENVVKLTAQNFKTNSTNFINDWKKLKH